MIYEKCSLPLEQGVPIPEWALAVVDMNGRRWTRSTVNPGFWGKGSAVETSTNTMRTNAELESHYRPLRIMVERKPLRTMAERESWTPMARWSLTIRFANGGEGRQSFFTSPERDAAVEFTAGAYGMDFTPSPLALDVVLSEPKPKPKPKPALLDTYPPGYIARTRFPPFRTWVKTARTGEYDDYCWCSVDESQFVTWASIQARIQASMLASKLAKIN